MNYWRDRRGQAMVEFAIIVPFFLLMMYAFAYLGMFLHDYLTLHQLTRVIARNVSVADGVYQPEAYSGTVFLTDVYRWNPQSGVAIVPPELPPGQPFTVTVTATRNMADGSFWADQLPPAISASLTMRKEE